MTAQLHLDGGETPPQRRALTERQQHALDTITRAGAGGCTSDDLGALLHQHRRAQGGRGHDADTRCDWCQQEGAAMGAALRDRGLVYRRAMRYWTLVEHRDTKATTRPNVPINVFPEGF